MRVQGAVEAVAKQRAEIMRKSVGIDAFALDQAGVPERSFLGRRATIHEHRGPAALLQMNRDFLQHDYYTDIITFGLSEKGQPVEAEVYISLDRVKENARIHGATQANETLRVVFHGALHLCGYKDKKKSEITLMRQKEDQYLRLFEKH